jgi:hypothetical protein
MKAHSSPGRIAPRKVQVKRFEELAARRAGPRGAAGVWPGCARRGERAGHQVEAQCRFFVDECPMKCLLRWLALAVFCTSLAACAKPLPGLGPLTYVIPQARLQQAIAKRFPYREGLGDLLELKLQAPRLSLLPERNRIGTVLDLTLSGRLLSEAYSGMMGMDYGLRFEPRDSTIRMTGVQVTSLNLDGVPLAYQDMVQRYAPRLAEQLLDDFPLHRISASDMARANGLGYELGGFKVVPEGLQVTLNPKPAPLDSVQ